MSDDFLVVGRIVGAQGLKGELKILPASDFPSRFTEPGPRWLKGKGQALQKLELLSGRPVPGKALFVVRFEGINSRTAAEPLCVQLSAAATAQNNANIKARPSATKGVKTHREDASTISACDTQNVEAKNQPNPAAPKMRAAASRLEA